ncbi:hypothetical protein AArcSl_2854 [Halalkaliarchaeum desulfuricum]|uniref:Domain of unknown function domain-containing protein n=1 Tax=Halalkaliarchaeum desulfuricum TaxID=2055893 RepID=A0A343TMZ7_9EURY|nr:hypothetical protein [Halalkaliarchaeum desulfuricum]AUX10469.1 hypothetical protein AArcSl_2854 [Halalkaliarchaeum desulfuricum]
MNTDINRDRGFLTEADRAYLLGRREMTHEGSKRNAEARIRQRVTDAILDFDLLVQMLSKKDRRQVFEPVGDDDQLLDGVTAMIAFAYLGLKEQGVDFEDALVPAVRSAEEAYAADQFEAMVDVDVRFDVETSVEMAHEEIAARLETGQPITSRELFSLALEHGHDVTRYGRIELAVTDDTDESFLERLAEYFDGTLRRPTQSRAVIELSADTD